MKKDRIKVWYNPVVLWLLLTVQITGFMNLAEINDFGWLQTIFTGAADAAVILSPYIFLKPKWRWSVAIPMLLVPIFLYSNLLYLRNFNDLMGLTTMFGVSNLNGEVTSSALTYVKWEDASILFPLPVFIIFFILRYRSITTEIFDKRQKTGALIIIPILFFLQQILLIYQFDRHYNSSNTPPYNPLLKENCYYKKFARKERKYAFGYYGFVPYMAVQIVDYLSPKYVTLSDAERQDIRNEIERLNTGMPLLDSIPDNSRKNLMLIVVESLNTDALRLKANGKPVMPYLTSLLRQDSMIVLENVMPQVGTGRSSDGRFMYQTGILPLPNDPVAMSYTDVRYPSLSEALDREGYEFDCGNPIQWNKVELSKSYGFTKLFSRDLMSKNMKSLGGRDPALVANALPIIGKMHKPFYVALNTMDMHDPYQEFGWKKSDAWKDPKYSMTEHVYIEKCRQFDASLSQLVASMKKSGIYDDTVIVIAGDHNAREAALEGERFVNTEIPVIILNSGVELRSKTPIGQIDVYPTILDVMGAGNDSWRGVGISALRNPKVRQPASGDTPDAFAYPSEQAWLLSERLIRSAYFRR